MTKTSSENIKKFHCEIKVPFKGSDQFDMTILASSKKEAQKLVNAYIKEWWHNCALSDEKEYPHPISTDAVTYYMVWRPPNVYYNPKRVKLEDIEEEE